MIARWVLTVFMVVAGTLHFISPEVYLGMMPSFMPAPELLVAISGVAEIAGGLGLILPKTRRLAAWGLVLLYVAVFPANVNMAYHELPLGTYHAPAWALWLRLPVQILLIAWAHRYTKSTAAQARAS